jgi:hypothetical protein
MKTFKHILSEVAQPKAGEEKAFKDQHKIELIKHPVAPDLQFTGEIESMPAKKKKPADYAKGEDEKAYDQAYSVKDKPFKMPRNIDEEIEELDEKALSQNQQQLMGMALALKRGEMDPSEASDTVQKLAKDMSMKDLEDFASTKHKGLPVKKESRKLSFKEMVDKVIDEEDLQENAYEEIPMMKSQLHYIMYAADEIIEFLDMGLDPEEWYQNKLAAVFHEMKSLHAYMEGEKRLYSTDGEDEDEDDLMMAYYGEEVEGLDEAVKVGSLKLNDGTTVKVSDKDSKLLNSLLNNLNAKNRQQMEKVMMTDKNGFEEILGFAREAV